MKKIFKRISAAVIALAVVLTAVVFDVPEKLIAAAAGETAQAEHTNHKVCVGATCDNCIHEEITDWEPISNEDGLKAMAKDKHYYLTADISLTAGVKIRSDITLCLNGHTIKPPTGSSGLVSDYIFEIGAYNYNPCTLTLCDCSTNKTGALIGGKELYSCVSIYNEDFTFNMFSGTIRGSQSGGVNVKGTFNMYGGMITNNTSRFDGGGVSVMSGTFNMNGGEISGNTARDGGCVYIGVNGQFTMRGGKISGNTATGNGGGVCFGDNSSMFRITGGEISGNTATENGGGIYISDRAMGTPMLTNAAVTGNKSGTGDAQTNNDIYLGTNKKLFISSPSTDSPIYIATATEPTVDTPVDIASSVSTDISDSFKASKDGQKIVYDAGNRKLQLIVAPHSHGFCGDPDCTDSSHPDGHNTEINWTGISDASGFSSLTDGGHYYLTAPVTLIDEVTIGENTDITLCLNGQTLTLEGHTQDEIDEEMRKPDFDMTSGMEALEALRKKRHFIIEGGTLNLCNCTGEGKLTTQKEYGGGVKINSGTFNMYGGEISNNTVYEHGGGVYVNNSGSTFNMYGGTISDNTADAHPAGGVYVCEGGIFNMYDGNILNNTASSGGGVYVSRALSTFNMYGGTIANNTAGENGGGGVFVNVSTFNMYGGTITGNKTICDEDGWWNNSYGGGVYFYDGTMKLDGKATITGNTATKSGNDVYLPDNKTLTIGANFSTDSSIGIATATEPTVDTPVDIATGVNGDVSSGFKADKGDQKIVYNATSNTLQLAIATHDHGVCGVSGCTDTNHPNGHTDIINWSPISDEADLRAMTNGGHYYLTDNININSVLTIANNTTITLCLNGKTITQTGNGKNIFKIGTVDYGGAELTAILNICDCSTDNSGTLTGGKGSYGGVEIRGTLNMYGGTISGNQSTGSGGGVSILFGTFNMYDGTITNNTATSSGGGVSVSAGTKFNMYGGTISDNKAKNGGGVYVSSLGVSKFTMCGGTITNNTATNSGGGVYAAKTELAGNVTITGNKAGTDSAQTDNDIYLPNNTTLTIGANFSTATIGITTQTAPICKTPVDITTNANVSEVTVNSFKAEIEGQEIVYNKIWKKFQLTVPHNFEGSEWTITKAPTAAATGTAQRTCTTEGCNGKETKTLPKIDLSGSGSVSDGWTVEYTAPTLTDDGKIEYKDEDSNVLATVEIPALNAASGEGGTSVWTKAEVGEGTNQSKNPTPTAGGTFVYTSADYGTVTVDVPALDNDAWTKNETTTPSISEGGEYTYTSTDYGTITVDVPALTDTGFWTKKTTGNTEPGVDTTGSYTYTSDYGEVTVEVPALSNETWTKDETTKPTISKGGEYTYTSDYGTVTVDVPALNDTEFWTKKTTGNTEPGEDTTGSYTYTSDDYGEVTVTVPNLSDTTVWTKDESKHVDPTEETTGKDVYTSAYGTVEVTIPALSSDNSCGDNATWTYDENTKTLTISGTGDMTDWTAENPAPWADKAADIEKVVIGGGITSIGDNAFENCTSLTDVTISDSVTAIGDGAFDGCTSLTEVTIPEGVETIGDNAFVGCIDLEKVTFEGENPPTMGSDVFDGCNVDKIVVPEGSEDAYKDESGFTGLTDKITADTGDNPGGDNDCGTNATWAYDETTKTLTITGTGGMDNWTAEDPAPWADKAADIEKVVIGDGITSIGDNAFEGCTGLTNVTISDSVAEIGDNAFAGCTDLETVTFKGENPPTMGSDVFKDCTVDKIVVPEGAEDAYKGESGFTDLTDKITADTGDNPGGDNACGTNATWAYDETTKTLTISGTGDMTDWTAEDPAPWADKAAEIEKVVIGDGITSIGDNAFEDCTALTNVTIPDSVVEIGNGAFDSCTSLTEVTIPEGVENIGDNAFAGCTDLETVTFEGENPPTMGSDVFGGCNVDKIVVPEGSEGAYKDESGFTDLTDKITADTSNNPGSDDGNTGEPENPGDNNDNNNSGDSDNSGDNSSNSGNSDVNENTSKDVQLGENVPKTEFATSTEELIKAVLDPEEIAQIKDSDEVSIILEVSETVSDEDKQKVESVLEANTELRFAQYMDITLYKVVNDIKTQVTTTNKPIRITFEVPANLRKSGRTFEVCRVHNGETALLPDLDDDENTVTIETDRFSTYALVYHDKASAPESGNPSTGIAVSFVPLAAALAAMVIIAKRRRK